VEGRDSGEGEGIPGRAEAREHGSVVHPTGYERASRYKIKAWERSSNEVLRGTERRRNTATAALAMREMAMSWDFSEIGRVRKEITPL